MAKHAASYNRLLAEKYKIALHILQLHRIKKQPDEDTMKKGARDGKACGAPRCKSGRDGVCLEVYVGYFLCFKTKKVTNLQLKKSLEAPQSIIAALVGVVQRM